MRHEIERIGGRRMQQEDIRRLKKFTKAKINEEGSFNSTGNLVITALN
jgi:hypothetical protein